MNFCLQFRSKDYSSAYMSSFSLLIRRKFFLGTILNLGILGIAIAKLNLKHAPGATASSAASITQIIISALWIAGVYCLKKTSGRFSKYRSLISFILDIMMLVSAVDFKPMTPKVDQSNFIELALSSWHQGVVFICYLSVITLWQIRVLACLIQAIIFMVTLIDFDSSSQSSGMVAYGFLVYAVTTYLNEKFERASFIEKAKLYFDSEAIKKILNNITEGILIVDQRNTILYSNSTIQTMLTDSKEINIENLFSQIRIKSLSQSGGRTVITRHSLSSSPKVII